jgi:hypothetical protein
MMAEQKSTCGCGCALKKGSAETAKPQPPAEKPQQK